MQAKTFKYQFKGTVSRDFLLLVFFMGQFPPAPEYPMRTVSNFFENSQRYSQVKVHHQYQQHRRQICRQCQICHRWQIATCIKDSGGKFATGVNDTSSKIWNNIRLQTP
jgi:hypothetical protein